MSIGKNAAQQAKADLIESSTRASVKVFHVPVRPVDR